jgi:hypothetical protein
MLSWIFWDIRKCNLLDLPTIRSNALSPSSGTISKPKQVGQSSQTPLFIEAQFPSAVIYTSPIEVHVSLQHLHEKWMFSFQISASEESILLFRCYYFLTVKLLTELLVHRYFANIRLLVSEWGQSPCISLNRDGWPRLCPQTQDSRQTFAFLCLKYFCVQVCSAVTSYNGQFSSHNFAASYTNHIYMYWIEHCWLVTSRRAKTIQARNIKVYKLSQNRSQIFT